MVSIGSCDVPAQNNTQLIPFQDWTLRVRPAEAQPTRLLLLIHGWTGDENSMWVFVRRFPARYWIVAPRAPFSTKPNGYSWRAASAIPGAAPMLEDLRPAASRIIGLADTFAAANGIQDLALDAIGFSQGAALVNTLALLYPQRLGRLGVLSGFVPAGAESLLSPHLLEGKSFFAAHGTRDDRVHVEAARKSVRALEGAGAKVTYCEDDVGHKLSAKCLHALEAFFA